MKLYTKGGDKGETSLFGGQRVYKDHLRLKAYGTVDELNSIIGVAICECHSEQVKEMLRKKQHQLFNVGAVLATPDEIKGNKKAISTVENQLIELLEKDIDFISAKLPPQRAFILPGGSKGAALLHTARTVCRRAERRAVTLSKEVDIDSNIIVYLNRLSDFLFALARYENYDNNIPDVEWIK